MQSTHVCKRWADRVAWGAVAWGAQNLFSHLRSPTHRGSGDQSLIGESDRRRSLLALVAGTQNNFKMPPLPGLGDIMGAQEASSQVAFHEFTPLQRVVLTANGNLQRIVSSYHNSPVSVQTRFSRRVAPGRYERQVDLFVFGTAFARATSTVHLEREDCVRAIEEEGMAIGQLFRRFNILPRSELEAAGFVPDAGAHANTAAPACAPLASAEPIGVGDDGASDATLAFSDGQRRFWRRYRLSGVGIECRIHEEIRCDLFALGGARTDVGQHAVGSVGSGSAPLSSCASGGATQPPSLGDIMAPATTCAGLPDGFTPLQRLLLTANGNVERIVSSYHHRPAQLFVALNHKRGCVHDRVVTLMLDGRQLMLAKSTCCLTDERWEATMEAEKLPIGALFRRFDVLPTFTLHSAGQLRGDAFWRQYELRAPGLTCLIHETFEAACLGTDEQLAHAGNHQHEHAYGI